MFVSSCNSSNEAEKLNDIEKQRDILINYFKPYGPALDFTWRYIHPEEKFISLEKYIQDGPSGITTSRNKIYILPLGEFTPAQNEIMRETAKYNEAFFGLEVELLPIKPMPKFPDSMKRKREGEWQYNTTYFLNTYLTIKEFDDAAVLIALTSNDLYPKDDWNYVFGIASLKDRIGIWSMYRFGVPECDSDSYRLCLDRARKISTHEISHMFSIRHCVSYPCVMNGSNSMPETDIHPSYLCPECLAKLSWDLNQTPKIHMGRMKKYWSTNKNKEMDTLYSSLISALE